jgi:hypothetical protein
MMLLLEEIGVEAAMIIATVTAAAVFVWATGTMLVRWFHYAKAEREASAEPASTSARPARLAGPSL